MTEEERRALGMSRRLAFQNIALGGPIERVMADLRQSQLEVEQGTRFVAKKITEHLVMRRQPPIACESMSAIRHNRKDLLAVLARIGDLDLSTSLILSRIDVQALDHPEMIDGAMHRMNEAYH